VFAGFVPALRVVRRRVAGFRPARDFRVVVFAGFTPAPLCAEGACLPPAPLKGDPEKLTEPYRLDVAGFGADSTKTSRR
jgi:hypothetical protein